MKTIESTLYGILVAFFTIPLLGLIVLGLIDMTFESEILNTLINYIN